MKRSTVSKPSKAFARKTMAILGITGHPGRADDGSDIEWILGAEADVASVGTGDGALAIAAIALRLLSTEISEIPTGKGRSDEHARQWMLKIAIHKAAIRIGAPFPSVAMHYLIEKTNEWGASIAETARQLLKNGMLPHEGGADVS